MRFKDTIKTAKKILKEAKKNPDHWTDEELQYVKMLKRQAKISLKRNSHNFFGGNQ